MRFVCSQTLGDGDKLDFGFMEVECVLNLTTRWLDDSDAPLL
ncbi:hypothetical protein [Scytonema sp. NUACC21]